MLSTSHPICALGAALLLCRGTGDGGWVPQGCSLCWDTHLGRRIRVLSWVNSSVVQTGCLRDSPEILCRTEKERNKTQASSRVTFCFEPSLSGNSSSKLLFGGWGGFSSLRTGNAPGDLQQAVNPLFSIRQLAVVWQGPAVQSGCLQEDTLDVWVESLPAVALSLAVRALGRGSGERGRACDSHRPCCSMIF